MPVDGAHELLAWAGHVLGQAAALAQAHEAPGAPPYAELVGPHLRHLIEHYERWLAAAGTPLVDYDRRPRDAGPAQRPRLARQRLLALQQRLARWPVAQLADAIEVQADIGASGEQRCRVASSAGRELLFATHHAVHHFALLQAHCRRHGLAVGADFGKAPATVAHERAVPPGTATPRPPAPEEAPCRFATPAA